MAARQHDERRRKIVHLAFGCGALALRYLLWWQAAIVAAAALAFNLFVLPRVAGQLYRPGERPQSARSGIVLYPASVLLLILVFHERLDIAAAAWAILAAGDGMATLVGRRFGRGGLPWNREKSVAGTLAFFCCGSLAGIFVAWWCRPNVTPQPDLWFSIAAPLVAALVAALVETIPIELDDNISVPVVGRRRALGAVARARRALVAGGADRRPVDRRRLGGERRRRVAGLAGRHGDNGWCRDRRAHRRRHHRDDGLGRLDAAAGDVPGGVDQLAAGPAPQDDARHRRGARWTAGARERHRQHRIGDGCGAPGRLDDAPRPRAPGFRHRSGCRRERHDGQRDRQGVGPSHVSRDHVQACAAGHVGGDVARRNDRRGGWCAPFSGQSRPPSG